MPATSRPSIFDMTGRAKWDAWAATGKQYEDPQEAEKRYLKIAQTLGWTEDVTEFQAESDSTNEISDNDEDDDPESSTSGGDGSMGLSVSIMMPPSTAIDRTIHGLALSNDVSGLTTLLEQCPETDLDALDEFVSPSVCTLSEYDSKAWDAGLYPATSCLRQRKYRHRQTFTKKRR